MPIPRKYQSDLRSLLFIVSEHAHEDLVGLATLIGAGTLNRPEHAQTVDAYRTARGLALVRAKVASAPDPSMEF